MNLIQRTLGTVPKYSVPDYLLRQKMKFTHVLIRKGKLEINWGNIMKEAIILL